MKVLFDIVHPAHVHFYRYMWEALQADGHQTLVVSRDKDVTRDLLDEFGMPHVLGSSGAGPSWLGQGTELLARDARLVRLGWSFKPDIVLTRNPAGTHAARVLRVPSIFDTDNGTSAGIHFRLAAPAATVITTPEGMGEHYGAKHREYPSYKSLAFLHPDQFTPDPAIHQALGLAADEPYSILRLVSMAASHDHGHEGVAPEVVRQVVERLSARGTVFVSAEGDIPDDLDVHRLPTSAGQFLSVLAGASLVVGDSGSVAAEAAMLGTMSVFYSSFAGKLAYLNELEDDYGLVRNLVPPDPGPLLDAVDALGGVDQDQAADQARARMLEDKIDLTEWYLDLVHETVDH